MRPGRLLHEALEELRRGDGAAEAAADVARALRARGEPDDAVDSYLRAKRREIDAWAPFALPSLRRWGVFAGARPIPRR